MELTRVLNDCIKSSQDSRPNAATGVVVSATSRVGSPTIYEIRGIHPGDGEPFICYSVVPISLSQGQPDLLPNTSVLLEVPQGKVAYSQIVSVLGVLPEETKTLNTTKDTSSTPAVAKVAPKSLMGNIITRANDPSVLGTPDKGEEVATKISPAKVNLPSSLQAKIPSTGTK